ncbi:MAG: DUF1570 domain-containing protein [Planctomycetaceae bacterium]
MLLAALVGLGCATVGDREPPLVPTRYETRTGPYAVFSNVPIAADAPAILSLESLEIEIEASLGIRVRSDEPPVEVYILNDRQSFTHFLRYYYPELPPRRAFFLAEGPRRVVYTYFGERLGEDLRHEATHALLNVAIGDLPLWLDEGLAEYFEGADGRHGRNPEHLGRLPGDLAAGWKPDLARLESLTSVSEMAPCDYRESWAWVHYLLNGSNTGKAALLAYLADLRTSPKVAPLSERLKADDLGSNARLLAHIDRVRTTPAPVASAPSSSEPTFRLQDNAIEPARPPGSSRRGLVGRLRALVGL